MSSIKDIIRNLKYYGIINELRGITTANNTGTVIKIYLLLLKLEGLEGIVETTTFDRSWSLADIVWGAHSKYKGNPRIIFHYIMMIVQKGVGSPQNAQYICDIVNLIPKLYE